MIKLFLLASIQLQLGGLVLCDHIIDGNVIGNEAACGGDVVGMVGWVAFPSQRGVPYDSFQACAWHFAPRPQPIQLRFSLFDLAPGSWLAILDPIDVVIIANYSGVQGMGPPRRIELTKEMAWQLVFRSALQQDNGFNLTFQQKGVCLQEQEPCGRLESDCYERSEQCDGVWDCEQFGADELGCVAGCRAGELVFGCAAAAGSPQPVCYPLAARCDGVPLCADLSDERRCLPLACNPRNGTFLCADGRCILETHWCDGLKHCFDGSDERACPRLWNRSLVAIGTMGSLFMALVMTMLAGCAVRYQRRISRARRARPRVGDAALPDAAAWLRCTRRLSPMTRYLLEYFLARPPPPTYPEAVQSPPLYTPFDPHGLPAQLQNSPVAPFYRNSLEPDSDELLLLPVELDAQQADAHTQLAPSDATCAPPSPATRRPPSTSLSRSLLTADPAR